LPDSKDLRSRRQERHSQRAAQIRQSPRNAWRNKSLDGEARFVAAFRSGIRDPSSQRRRGVTAFPPSPAAIVSSTQADAAARAELRGKNAMPSLSYSRSPPPPTSDSGFWDIMPHRVIRTFCGPGKRFWHSFEHNFPRQTPTSSVRLQS
jgi:hypothetical protein